MGIAANLSVLTQLSFVIKNLKNSCFANLLASRKSYSSPIESGHVKIKFFIMAKHSKCKLRKGRLENLQN